jgi:hypothetical protein
VSFVEKGIDDWNWEFGGNLSLTFFVFVVVQIPDYQFQIPNKTANISNSKKTIPNYKFPITNKKTKFH